jgi:hypothetical protein
MKRSVALALGLLALAFSPAALFASDYSSSAFIVRDPVITMQAGYASSVSFQYYSTGGQISAGEDSSASFQGMEGFEYFPGVSTPIVLATAGDAQVTVSFTGATGYLGATVASYEIGRSVTSGSGYIFTNVGTALSSVQSGLSNGTPYYFVVRALDSLGHVVVTSAQTSATPIAPSSSGGGGGGGGGGGSTTPSTASIQFVGHAYPGSEVTLLKDAQVVASVTADADARFAISLYDLTPGNYIFSLYAEDISGIRSNLSTFPASITKGATTSAGGIFIPPTIGVDQPQVERGDNIAILGQSLPNGVITIVVNSAEPHYVKTNADDDGIYLYNFDTAVLEEGHHITKSKAANGNEISTYGSTAEFVVGSGEGSTACGKADLNCDGRVNLVDFSIAAYWYGRPLSDDFKVIEARSLNGDAAVNIIDFSIMAYYWSG